jgi:hypothetical protein
MKNFFIFLFIFLLPIVNSATLSMSPQQIDFQGNTGEKICNQINLKTPDEATLIGETNWAEKGYLERKLKNHNLLEEDLDLIIEYPKIIKIINNKSIEVCITGKKPGNYHGIILYRIEDKPIRVGIWMNVSLEKKGILRTTGKIIDDKSNNNSNFFIGITFLLLLIFLALIWKLKKPSSKKPNTEFV